MAYWKRWNALTDLPAKHMESRSCKEGKLIGIWNMPAECMVGFISMGDCTWCMRMHAHVDKLQMLFPAENDHVSSWAAPATAQGDIYEQNRSLRCYLEAAVGSLGTWGNHRKLHRCLELPWWRLECLRRGHTADAYMHTRATCMCVNLHAKIQSQAEDLTGLTERITKVYVTWLWKLASHLHEKSC